MAIIWVLYACARLAWIPMEGPSKPIRKKEGERFVVEWNLYVVIFSKSSIILHLKPEIAFEEDQRITGTLIYKVATFFTIYPPRILSFHQRVIKKYRQRKVASDSQLKRFELPDRHWSFHHIMKICFSKRRSKWQRCSL